MRRRRVAAKDFACRCGARERRRCDRVLKWAMKFLGIDERERLMDAVVSKLHWDYGAEISRIGTDQWHGIWTEPYEDGGFKTYIQCDRLLDGLAFTIRAYYDEYGAEKPDRWEEDE